MIGLSPPGFDFLRYALRETCIRFAVAFADNFSYKSASSQVLLAASGEPQSVHLYDGEEQHANWIRCITTREETAAPPEIAHRSGSACLIAHIAMKLKRALRWDPDKEEFIDDDETNAMRTR